MMLLVPALILFLTVLMACIVSVEIPRARLDAFELKRLVAREDSSAIKQQKLEVYHEQLRTLFRLKEYALLLIASFVSVAVYGWASGLVLVIGIVFLHSSVARLSFITTFSRKRAVPYIDYVLRLLDQHQWLRKLLRGPRSLPIPQHSVHSRDELLHLIDATKSLSHQDKELLLHAAEFDSRTVDELMVVRTDIISVEKKEVLGPLVLDDLHKTGHSSFPVTDKSLDTVVGTLYLRDMLLIDATAQTVTAEKAMQRRVAYTHQHDTLRQAIAAFLEHRTHLLIVIGTTNEVAGLLTFDDVIEALFGEKLRLSE